MGTFAGGYLFFCIGNCVPAGEPVCVRLGRVLFDHIGVMCGRRNAGRYAELGSLILGFFKKSILQKKMLFMGTSRLGRKKKQGKGGKWKDMDY